LRWCQCIGAVESKLIGVGISKSLLDQTQLIDQMSDINSACTFYRMVKVHSGLTKVS